MVYLIRAIISLGLVDGEGISLEVLAIVTYKPLLRHVELMIRHNIASVIQHLHNCSLNPVQPRYLSI